MIIDLQVKFSLKIQRKYLKISIVTIIYIERQFLFNDKKCF